jgi:hypothetical protein
MIPVQNNKEDSYYIDMTDPSRTTIDIVKEIYANCTPTKVTVGEYSNRTTVYFGDKVKIGQDANGEWYISLDGDIVHD